TKAFICQSSISMKIIRRNWLRQWGIALLLVFPLGATGADLPTVSERLPLAVPHFPDAAHAVVWRNWQLVEPERLAAVLGTSAEKVVELAGSMGLPKETRVPTAMRERGYITLLRRNWHLLPYEQLLQLLDISADEMAFRLREDDFLYIKLGSIKPQCPFVRYREPDAKSQQRAAEIKAV